MRSLKVGILGLLLLVFVFFPYWAFFDKSPMDLTFRISLQDTDLPTNIAVVEDGQVESRSVTWEYEEPTSQLEIYGSKNRWVTPKGLERFFLAKWIAASEGYFLKSW